MATESNGNGQAGLVVGLGTGRCGTHSLVELLNRQPESAVTHEEFPLLPWRRVPGYPGIAERLRRIRRSRTGRLVGDVASFYLPYAEEAIALDPSIRMICLERPREEVVASFSAWLDAVHPLPTDHWSRVPGPGWHHELFWTRIFPQYDAADRAAGIGLYWDEYHRTAAALAQRFPRQFQVFPTESLNTESGQSALLTFAGIPQSIQVLAPGIRSARAGEVGVHPRRMAPPTADRYDPRRCVVLVPFASAIAPACEAALRELERRGYEVRRASGCDSDDLLRSRMATAALLDGYDELMWVGSKIGFLPDDVERLRRLNTPMACALYPRPGEQRLWCQPLPGNSLLLFGAQGGLHEMQHAGLGFMLVRRAVFLDIQKRHGLPICHDQDPQPIIPFFQPVIGPYEDGYRWLESDFAFCEWARQCGYSVVADTTIRVFVEGPYLHGWEDAGAAPARYASYHLKIN